MAKITSGDVDHIAELSRLEFKREEQKKYTGELEKILTYIDELKEAPTDKVEPIDQIGGLSNVSRDDEINESLATQKVLENAPEKQAGFIKVKKIFD